MAGSYSAGAGSSACIQCPAGQFNGSPGSTSCDQCSAGSAAPVDGSDSCDKCGPGRPWHRAQKLILTRKKHFVVGSSHVNNGS